MDWKYRRDFDKERLGKLNSFKDFYEIVDLLIATSKVVSFVDEGFKSERLKGCKRASFRIQTSKDAFDGFYNSKNGYRGQYAVSEQKGMEANNYLIEKYSSLLADYLELEYPKYKVGH